jgi:hypothetical protein
VRRSGGVGSARPREAGAGAVEGGDEFGAKRSRFYVLVRTSEAGFGDAPPSGYSRGPPCPWPAPTSRSHRRRTPSGASARFGSPRSEASSGDRAARSEELRARNHLDVPDSISRSKSARRRKAKPAPPPFTVRLRLPSLHTPIPRENSAARPARATPPFRAEARPQAVPEARHARRP